MKNIHSITFYTGSKEELLPDFANDFPYIASRAELDKYIEHYVPWHWHKAVEFFYTESGSLEYYTPKGKQLFPAGSGGMVNSNILHMTRPVAQTEKNVQLLHIFLFDSACRSTGKQNRTKIYYAYYHQSANGSYSSFSK